MFAKAFWEFCFHCYHPFFTKQLRSWHVPSLSAPLRTKPRLSSRALWSSRVPLLLPRRCLSGLRPPGSPPPQLLPAVDQQWTQNMRPPFFMSLAPSLSPNFGLNVMSLNSADLMRWFICPFLICLPLPDSKVCEHRDPCDVTTCHRVWHKEASGKCFLRKNRHVLTRTEL